MDEINIPIGQYLPGMRFAISYASGVHTPYAKVTRVKNDKIELVDDGSNVYHMTPLWRFELAGASPLIGTYAEGDGDVQMDPAWSETIESKVRKIDQALLTMDLPMLSAKAQDLAEEIRDGDLTTDEIVERLVELSMETPLAAAIEGVIRFVQPQGV